MPVIRRYYQKPTIMNRLFLVSILLLGLAISAFRLPLAGISQTDGPGPGKKRINWMTVEQAYVATQKKPKKLVVDVYTSWCGWCKVMDRETFSKPAIIDYVNENYYAVKLNAEQTADITLGKQTFKYRGTASGRGAHELAAMLMKNQMSYPTTVFLDEKFNLIQPIAGYLEPRTFHQIVTYFGQNYYQKEPFDQYKIGTYKSEFGGSLTAGK